MVNGGFLVSVLAIDDQAVFRGAVRELIEATDGFEQIGEAASGREGIEMALERHPDLVLVDIRMPDMDGIETARRIARELPSAVVVLISMEGPPDLPSSLAAAHAAAYVRKQDLCAAVLRDLWRDHGRSLATG